jgi:hypothetical protein
VKIPDKISKAFQSAVSGNYAAAFFRLWMGRCTFFAIAFSVVGMYGWLHLNRDLTSFSLFAGAIQALLLAHSYKEDIAEQNQAQQQQTTVVNDITIQK